MCAYMGHVTHVIELATRFTDFYLTRARAWVCMCVGMSLVCMCVRVYVNMFVWMRRVAMNESWHTCNMSRRNNMYICTPPPLRFIVIHCTMTHSYA